MVKMLKGKVKKTAMFFVVFIALCGASMAAEKAPQKVRQKKPPLLVTTVEMEEGNMQPMAEFIGTTYYARVSKVATEIEGLVNRVNVDVGGRVEKGATLVVLDAKLLNTEIEGARAALEQNQVDLDNARREFKRIDVLYRDKSVSEIDHDSYFAKQEGLEKRAMVLGSKLNRLLIVRGKKNIIAPFAGTIIEKSTEVGQWLSKGGKALEVADHTNIDVLVDVPVVMLEFLIKGRTVNIAIGDKKLTGELYTFIPKSDIATRTFTIKFRLQNHKELQMIEGLEAHVSLPKGKLATGMLIPRDAVVDKYGKTMVFICQDRMAKMIPVQVVGYSGLQAVVTGSGLQKGQLIIVKGSKRVDDGDQVQFRK